MIINEVMRTIQTPGHSQDILQIFLRTFQHASGLSKPLLEYPNERAPHLEGHYYVYLRKFLAKHNIQLEFACVQRPTIELEGDHLFMDRACGKIEAGLNDASIQTINYCWSYLQVHRLSDICTADGNYILESELQGERSEGQHANPARTKSSKKDKQTPTGACGGNSSILFVTIKVIEKVIGSFTASVTRKLR